MFVFRPQIFVSYAHDDRRWFDKGSLMPRLIRSLESLDDAEVWYDRRRLTGGDPWRQEIEAAIDRAHIAILLVSSYFIVSDFIRTVELSRIAERAKDGRLVIVPILVGHCQWRRLQVLEGPQMIPGEPTPLVEYRESEAKWEKVQHDILSDIESLIDKVRLRLNVTPARAAESATPSPSSLKAPNVERVPVPVTPPAELVMEKTPTRVTTIGGVPQTVRATEDIRTAFDTALATVTDDNSQIIWSQLSETHKDNSLDMLLAILRDPRRRSEDHHRALLLVQHAIHRPEVRAAISSILDTVRNHTLGPNFVANAALKLIVGSPVSTRQKWECLFPLIASAAPDKATLIVSYMKPLIPADRRQETGAAVLDKLATMNTVNQSVDAYVEILKLTNYKAAIPTIKDLIPVSDVTVAASLASLLVVWRDTEAGPAVRLAVENHRLTPNGFGLSDLMASLYAIEGPACADYLAQVLRDAAPFPQERIFQSFLGNKKDPAFVDVATNLVETTGSPGVRKAAEAFLQKL